MLFGQINISCLQANEEYTSLTTYRTKSAKSFGAAQHQTEESPISRGNVLSFLKSGRLWSGLESPRWAKHHSTPLFQELTAKIRVQNV